MKPSHLLVRAQIFIGDTYTRLIAHAKGQLGISEPEHPIELGLPVSSKATWRVFRDGELVREFDQVEAATAYARVGKVWLPGAHFEIKKVTQC